MTHPLEQLRDDALREIDCASDEQTLETARIKFLGKNGSISRWGEDMRTLGKDQKPIVGKLVNEDRNDVTEALESHAGCFHSRMESHALGKINISMPGT